MISSGISSKAKKTEVHNLKPLSPSSSLEIWAESLSLWLGKKHIQLFIQFSGSAPIIDGNKTYGFRSFWWRFSQRKQSKNILSGIPAERENLSVENWALTILEILKISPSQEWLIPSGKRLHNYGKIHHI